jgi:hypothetical protein
MKGYGLTVMSGTKVERFDVEIVSVIPNWGMHQDVVLARLSGLNLEETSIIAGMSGSPCYIPYEGKDRMIGAVAYGWQAQKGTLCGIQPITQMIAASTVISAATTQPTSSFAREAPAENASEFLAAAMNPKKIDLLTLFMKGRDQKRSAGSLTPLPIPMNMSGVSERTLQEMDDLLNLAGVLPVRSGSLGAGSAQAGEREGTFVPGGGISVQLAGGDVDFNAVGTVTEVIGDHVLAFGHEFTSEGSVEYPMGPAYIHTVVPTILRSFKIGSSMKMIGTLNRDEMVGVSGLIGAVPRTIPLTVDIHWPEGIQTFSYRIAKHRTWTPLLTALLLRDSIWSWKLLPYYHTIEHEVEIDFGELGRYHCRNISSGSSINGAYSDAIRPLATLLDSPFGPPPEVQRITIRMNIREGDTTAEILKMRLDGKIYRPGDTLTGVVTVRPFRQENRDISFRFPLPKELPDGTYKLTACDNLVAMNKLQQEQPQWFKPRTIPELFKSLQRVVSLREDQIYFRLPLTQGGMSLGQQRLPELPDSQAQILKQADVLDTFTFSDAEIRPMASEYVLSGEVAVEFNVQKNPTEILLHQDKE